VLPFGVRKICALAVATGLMLLAPTSRAAEPVPPSDAAPAPASSTNATRAGLAGFSVLAMGGWGATTSTIRHLELAPYAATFGLDVGYTFRSGLRLGGYFDYSLGHSVKERRDPLIGRDFDFTAVSSSLGGGISLGWDVPIYVIVLRYSVGLGVTSMKWDFGQIPKTILHYDVSNPTVSFHVAPGLALLYEHGLFEAGVGFDYFAQTSGTIPNGFLGKVLCGVKL
jgi:hypothetical protein